MLIHRSPTIIKKMKPNPLPFLREKWAGVLRPSTSFVGKTAIVTGANTGIGFEAAATLCSLAADRIILAVRSVEKGGQAKDRIQAHGHYATIIEVWQLDMGNYGSVRSFASQVEKEIDRLDLVILNAGISPNDYIVGNEGWESILQVNVMSTALLGLLLLPKMRESGRQINSLSSLLIVTSEAHRWLEQKDFPNADDYGGNMLLAVNAKPEGNTKWNPLLQNARSKLIAMYISKSMAALANGVDGKPSVIVTSVCPGACKSDLTRDLLGKSYSQSLALRMFNVLFNKPTEQGGWSYIQAAILGVEAHGKWYKTNALTQYVHVCHDSPREFAVRV